MTQTHDRGTCEFSLQGNLILIEVAVNDVPGRFLLDTGAGVTLLAQALADRLGLKAADKSAGFGAGGDVTLTIVPVDSLSVAGIVDRDVACMVMDLGELGTRIGTAIDGVLGFDFFGTGILHIDYPARRVAIERPRVAEPRRSAAIDGRIVRIPHLGIELAVPARDWSATTDTPLPTIPVILNGPRGAKVTVSEIKAQGLSVAAMKASMDASAKAQVDGFERLASRDVESTGRPAYRLDYRGTREGVRQRVVALAVLLDGRWAALTCEAPEESFTDVAPAIEATLESVHASR
jgi:Aspartyl protease